MYFFAFSLQVCVFIISYALLKISSILTRLQLIHALEGNPWENYYQLHQVRVPTFRNITFPFVVLFYNLIRIVFSFFFIFILFRFYFISPKILSTFSTRNSQSGSQSSLMNLFENNFKIKLMPEQAKGKEETSYGFNSFGAKKKI